MATINFDLTSLFTSDLIVNGSDTSQTAIDANYSLMTQSLAVGKGGTSSQGLPDNGVFAANTYHQAFDLLYDNTDNGNNGILATATGTFVTFNVTNQAYSALHLFATSGGGASNITVTFNYSDGTNSTATGTVPDWYTLGNITESQDRYYLSQTLNVSTPNASALGSSAGITNDIKLFGLRFTPNSAKILQSVSINKTSTTGKLAFFGAAGVYNASPTITSGNAVNFAENGTGTVYTTVASYPENATLIYSLTGTDADLFNIDNSGLVTFKTAPNFEAPSDNGGNNIYDIIVNVSDGSLTATQNVAITVTDVNEPANLFEVTQDTDNGLGDTAGSLSWAIKQANNTAGLDTIKLTTNVRLAFASDVIRMKTLINSDMIIDGNGKIISGDNNNNGQVDTERWFG